jgi:hypothetical protein
MGLKYSNPKTVYVKCFIVKHADKLFEQLNKKKLSVRLSAQKVFIRMKNKWLIDPFEGKPLPCPICSHYS